MCLRKIYLRKQINVTIYSVREMISLFIFYFIQSRKYFHCIIISELKVTYSSDNYQLFKQNMMFHGLSFHNAIGKYIHTHTNEWYEKWNLSWPVYSTAKSATPGFRYLHRMMFAAETTHRVFPFLIAHCTRNESRDKRTVQY